VEALTGREAVVCVYVYVYVCVHVHVCMCVCACVCVQIMIVRRLLEKPRRQCITGYGLRRQGLAIQRSAEEHEGKSGQTGQ